jgi:hypothetical protein
VDNQHEQITGYRDLSKAEIDDMNSIKKLASDVGSLVEYLRQPGLNYDQRWVSIGVTQLQQGFMALTRAVAKPTTF